MTIVLIVLAVAASAVAVVGTLSMCCAAGLGEAREGKEMTDIQWTHQDGYKGETWNPIAAFNIETGKRGWMCSKPSAGCKNCYAEELNRFRGNGLPYAAKSLDQVRYELVNIDQPLHWRMPRVGVRVLDDGPFT
jgi:protein gp37